MSEIVLAQAGLQVRESLPHVVSVEALPHSNGEQVIVKFENGYGASVIRHHFGHGGPRSLWELAVLGAGDEPVYDTPITNDVLGHLSGEEVVTTLRQIADLEPTVAPHDSADCASCDDHADATLQADRDETALGGAQ